MHSSSHRSRASLVPPLAGTGDDFRSSGQGLAIAVSPGDDTIAVHVTPHGMEVHPSEEQRIYLTQPEQAPLHERRTFVVDTSIVFSTYQRFLRDVEAAGRDLPRDDEALDIMNKLALDFVTFIRETCAVTLLPSGSQPNQEPLQFPHEHYLKVLSCFELFALLYVPEASHTNAPVGDELMEWLNTHFTEPSTEEGDALNAQEQPWEDSNFWPYLIRSTLRGLTKASAFFLGVLSKHPSRFLRDLSQKLIPLITDHPRLYQCATEREYLPKFRKWKYSVRQTRIELNNVPEVAREENHNNWWRPISDIVGILEGEQNTLKRVCSELGADWKELCAAWCIFVQPHAQRGDLPAIVLPVLEEMPVDPTNPEDLVHSSLMSGEPLRALADAARLDIWLPAHMSIFLEPLNPLDFQEPDDSGFTLREHYLLSYIDYMRLDPGLWRITVGYMYTCGEVGKEMADQILMRVPLRLDKRKGKGAAVEDADEIRAGNLTGVLKDVLETCQEYQREEVRRMVCKIVAQTFLREREYGLAVSYIASAEDWQGLGHLVEHVLEEFVIHGPEKFSQYVADVAPSLQAASVQARGVFAHRLTFAVRFAEFHQRRQQSELQEAAHDLMMMFRADMAPKSWWAVLLWNAVELLQYTQAMLFSSADACLLLHRLEEIHIRTSQGASEDYLYVLARMTKSGGEKHALQRLQTVRLALARYYARCSVLGTGGK